jgi:hypothetical protein
VQPTATPFFYLLRAVPLAHSALKFARKKPALQKQVENAVPVLLTHLQAKLGTAVCLNRHCLSKNAFRREAEFIFRHSLGSFHNLLFDGADPAAHDRNLRVGKAAAADGPEERSGKQRSLLFALRRAG